MSQRADTSTSSSSASSTPTAVKIAKGVANFFNLRKPGSSKEHINLAQQDDAMGSIHPVDQKILKESEIIVREFGNFIQSTNEMIERDSKKSPFLLLNSVKISLSKKKGNEFYQAYENMIQRSDENSSELRKLIDRSLNDSSAMVIQAFHVKKRLQLCVKFNKYRLSQLEPMMSVLNSLKSSIEKQTTDIKQMLLYYDDVMKIHETQAEFGESGAYIPWALKVIAENASTNITKVHISRETFEKRQRKLGKVLSVVEKVIKEYRPSYDLVQKKLQVCKRSIVTLDGLLSKVEVYKGFLKSEEDDDEEEGGESPDKTKAHGDGFDDDEDDATVSDASVGDVHHGDNDDDDDDDSKDQEDEQAQARENAKRDQAFENPIQSKRRHKNLFVPGTLETTAASTGDVASSNKSKSGETSIAVDHSGCADCLLVYEMATECAVSIGATHILAQESTRRLQKLFMAKDKAKRRAEALDKIHWGDAR